MNRDDCVKALARHASIRPLVTLTVWKELIKVNENFFQTYFHSLSPRAFNNCRPAQRLMPGNRSMVVKKNNPNNLSRKRIYY
ncbi:hypothetical protein Sjap_016134 [Stephania japonica]|uniref:Uncharacterized protein n=1 Tax=Stephania japonica TaxID=461633 RepID=A0AAP0NRJ6_9MAGN